MRSAVSSRRTRAIAAPGNRNADSADKARIQSVFTVVRTITGASANRSFSELKKNWKESVRAERSERYVNKDCRNYYNQSAEK